MRYAIPIVVPFHAHNCYLQEVKSMLDLLDKLDSWIDEIPPLPTPQRFGNLAFRTWGKRLEDVRSVCLIQLCRLRLQ